MKNVVSAAVIAIMLTACATTHMDESALPLIGYWYGEIELDDQRTQKWVVARHTDGTYWASFECIGDEPCNAVKEHGIWGLDDNVYWVKTMLLIGEKGPFYPDTQDKMYHLTYKVIDVSTQTIEYQDAEMKKTYRLERVSKQFAAEFEDEKLRNPH